MQAHNFLTFITGPAHSGKSRQACTIANHGKDTLFIGTASPKHPHMEARIAELKSERPAHWLLIDRPDDLATLLLNASAVHEQIIVDSLNLWLATIAVKNTAMKNPVELMARLRLESDRLNRTLAAARHAGANLILVGSESGASPTPPVETERAFREANGLLNQAVAAAADRVILLTAGIPQTIHDRSMSGIGTREAGADHSASNL